MSSSITRPPRTSLELLTAETDNPRLLDKLPFLDKCLDELHTNKQTITCPACEHPIPRDIISWGFHWRVKHRELMEELEAEGVEW